MRIVFYQTNMNFEFSGKEKGNRQVEMNLVDLAVINREEKAFTNPLTGPETSFSIVVFTLTWCNR